MARPSDYTPELAETICERIAEGESLRAICDDDEMPSKKTVMRWLRKEEEFRHQYARAREDQAEHYLDEIIEIADDGTNDYMTITKGDISYNVEDREVTSRSKMRIDTRKWAMAKLAPKKYGDKLDITSGGEKVAPQFYILPDGSRVEF